MIQIQQQVLEGVSEYFVAAFQRGRTAAGQSGGTLQSGPFEESKSGIFKFPEDSVDVWKILARWIILRKVPRTLLSEDLLLAIRCWIIGDQYLVKEFQDDIMVCMLEKLSPFQGYWARRGELTIEMLRVVYENTAEGSNLRKLVIELEVLNLKDNEDTSRFDEANVQKAFALDGTGYLPHLAQSNMEWKATRDKRYTGSTGGKENWKYYMEGSAKSA